MFAIIETADGVESYTDHEKIDRWNGRTDKNMVIANGLKGVVSQVTEGVKLKFKARDDIIVAQAEIIEVRED